MTKKGIHFFLSALAFLALTLLFYGVTYYIFPGDEPFTLLLTVLVVVASFLLTDMLMVWLIILAVFVATVILVFGISYVGVPERLFALSLLPIYGLFSLFVKHQYYQYITDDETHRARRYYRQLLHHTNKQKFPLMVGLVSWAHFKQFKEVNPDESTVILSSIHRKLRQHKAESHIFYLGNGSFVSFMPDEGVEDMTERAVLKESLEAITFGNFTHEQTIQFQIAKRELTQEAAEETTFEELIGRLERQLETEIVIEY